MSQNHPYHIPREQFPEVLMPPRPKALPANPDAFGQRLAHLRQTAGYTQTSFAQEVGISQRMVAYFENENGNPPMPLLRKFVRALGISADQLLGLEKVTIRKRPRDTRLQKRFSQVENLPDADKKHVARYLDNVIRLAKLDRKKTEG